MINFDLTFIISIKLNFYLIRPAYLPDFRDGDGKLCTAKRKNALVRENKELIKTNKQSRPMNRHTINKYMYIEGIKHKYDIISCVKCT